MNKDPEQIAFARQLRRNQTAAETLLWRQLRAKQANGTKFRRQQPIGPYVVDFVTFGHRPVIEVDGGHHDEKRVREEDKTRTAWLEADGYRVLRFWNNEVLSNIEGVLDRIHEALSEPHHPHPHPHPSRERERRPPSPCGREPDLS